MQYEVKTIWNQENKVKNSFNSINLKYILAAEGNWNITSNFWWHKTNDSINYDD